MTTAGSSTLTPMSTGLLVRPSPSRRISDVNHSAPSRPGPQTRPVAEAHPGDNAVGAPASGAVAGASGRCAASRGIVHDDFNGLGPGHDVDIGAQGVAHAAEDFSTALGPQVPDPAGDKDEVGRGRLPLEVAEHTLIRGVDRLRGAEVEVYPVDLTYQAVEVLFPDVFGQVATYGRGEGELAVAVSPGTAPATKQ